MRTDGRNESKCGIERRWKEKGGQIGEEMGKSEKNRRKNGEKRSKNGKRDGKSEETLGNWRKCGRDEKILGCK